MTGTPERSLAQRMEALQRANDVRSARKRLKEQIVRGDLAVIAVIVEPPADARSMKVGDLLLAVPKVGHVKADKILRRAGTAPSKTLGGLSPRQRTELAASTRAFCPGALV